jgi:hypothetical protein
VNVAHFPDGFVAASEELPKLSKDWGHNNKCQKCLKKQAKKEKRTKMCKNVFTKKSAKVIHNNNVNNVNKRKLKDEAN